MVSNIINDFMQEIGLQKMQSNEDPYKWIQKNQLSGKWLV